MKLELLARVASYSACLVAIAGCHPTGTWPPDVTCQPGDKPPLVKAIEAGNRSQVAQLLRNGANPNEGQPPFGPPPLYIAIQKGDPEIILILKEHGAKTASDLSERWSTKDGSTPP